MRTVASDLNGVTLGVYGLGNIGSAVAKVGVAFGMTVIAWSRNLTDTRAGEVGAVRVDREAMWRDSDVVTVHLPLTEDTAGGVGTTELLMMKPSAGLVNTSRGPICTEAAVTDACRHGQIAWYAVDAFDEEPLPPDHPFRSLPNVFASPHVGYVARSNYEVFFRDIVADIEAYLDGAPVRVLNPDVLSR